MLEMLTLSNMKILLPYLLLALTTMVEGPVSILVGGASISTGQLLPIPVLFSVVVGNLVADLGWYELGRFGKWEWLEKLGSRIGIDLRSIQSLENNVEQNAARMVFLSKFTIGLPIPTLVALGLQRVNIQRWLVAWVTGEVVKSTILVIVGYLSAAGIMKAFGGVQIVLWLLTAVLVISITYKLTRHKKKHISL